MHRDWNGNFLLPEIPPLPQKYVDIITSEWPNMNNVWDEIEKYVGKQEQMDKIKGNGFDFREGDCLVDIHNYIRELEFFKNLANDTSDPMYGLHRISYTRVMKIYAELHDFKVHKDGGRAYEFAYVLDAGRGFDLMSYAEDDWENPICTTRVNTGDWFYLRTDQPHNAVFEDDIFFINIDDWQLTSCMKRFTHECDCRFSGRLCKEGLEDGAHSVQRFNYLPTSDPADT